MHELPAGELALQACHQTRRQRRPIPQAQLGQPAEKLTVHVEVDALPDQQPFDAIHVARAFRFQGQQLAVQLAMIFSRQAGHMHHAPHAGLTGVVAHEHGQQLLDVEAVSLGVFAAAADLNAGRIHDQVGNVLACQAAVQPEAIPTGFIATHHWRIGR